MSIGYGEKLRRIHMIKGVYFKSHAVGQGKERFNGVDFDELEREITRHTGRFYWDTKHENYQFVLPDKVLAFDLKLHEDRPGLLAYVRTVLPRTNKFRDSKDRFKELKLSDYFGCARCQRAAEKTLKKLNNPKKKIKVKQGSTTKN